MKKWPPVPPMDFSALSPEDFDTVSMDYRRNSNAKESMPYFLKNFSSVANCVIEEGPQRGYIDALIWRVPSSNQPYNARVLESHLCLSYFYCTKAKWNPYYGMEAVKVRLEAMLEYLLSLQLPDGKFPEYGVAQGNLPATAFFTKFMAETIRLIKNGPEFDKNLLQRMIDANRKAIYVVLTDKALIHHGWSYSNQFTNIWAGGLAHIAMFPDTEIEEMLLRSMKDETYGKFQSEAGFYYEKDQPDWGYTLNTHNSNDRYAWHYAKNTPFEALLIEHTQRYYEWLSYNCLKEPDGSGFLFNRAIESRQRLPFAANIETELAEKVELARAFTMSKCEVTEKAQSRKNEWAKKWPDFTEINLNRTGGFTPYSFLFEGIPKWNPTKEEKTVVTAQLPYIKNRRFIHQRMDYRTQLVNLFVRRENYYCAFNSGKSFTEQQRFGLGFLWNHEGGMFIQSQSASDLAVWGFSKNGNLFEKSLGIRDVYYKLDGRRTSPVIGCTDWADKVLTVEYIERGERRKICFEDDHIVIENRFTGDISEHIPLMILPDDNISWCDGMFTLHRSNRILTVCYGENCKVRMDMQSKVARYQLAVLTLSSADGVCYKVKIV